MISPSYYSQHFNLFFIVFHLWWARLEEEGRSYYFLFPDFTLMLIEILSALYLIARANLVTSIQFSPYVEPQVCVYVVGEVM